jgi:acyl-CoA synthetase (AMP-forming)/AMP-acid ligase II
MNHRLTASERAAVLDRAAPAFVLACPDTESGDRRAELVEPAPALDDLLPSLRRHGATPGPVAAAPDDPVAIVFTSGTTGVPKGAQFCHRQLAFVTRTDVGDSWGGGTRTFTGTSFAHLGFMTKLEGNLRRGGTTHVMERWSAGGALRLIAEHRMATVAGVPAQLALMLRHPDFDRFDVSSVRFVVVGGGPLTPGLADEIRQRFGAQLATRYSCTEAGVGLGTAFGDPPEDAVESVGRPHPSVELAVLDADDRALPSGSTGAVCLRSPAVMSGYWRDPGATALAFTADGFVRTGDLGVVDDRGRLRLAGRSKEMYVRGGYNVYPVEVEAVLSTARGVAEIAIASRDDPVMGETGVAVVVPADARRPPSLADLREHGCDRLAPYKLPEAVRIVDALPLTSMEKLDRRALGELVRPEPDDDVS